MTPTPPSTTSSGVHSPEEQFKVVRKRNRVPLSCYPCRSRKLKCDRGHPCSNCVKREGGDTNTCSYAAPAARKKNPPPGAPAPDDMQNRIDRLEGLVLHLMQGGDGATAEAAAAAAVGTTKGRMGSSSITESASSFRDSSRMDQDGDDEDDDESDTDDNLAATLGTLKMDPSKGKSMYVGQEHWHTLLADIAEVKNYFSTHVKELEKSYENALRAKPASARDAPTLLIGAPPATELELRAELPPKSSVLALCGRYFNSMDNAVNLVHAPTFHAQLRTHWQDPSKTSVMWLGLLYSILCLAMLSYHSVGDEPPEWKGRALELAALYRVRTVQCLVVADYTKPSDYTLETLVLYVFGEFSSRWDADLGLWVIVGMITRLAFRLGYHRDPKWFPAITPFQGEMRRRAWALIRMGDVIFSHHVSLPNMIYDHNTDTELPHNLFDEEFGPDTKVLPPSRPNSKPTPMSFMIAKTKLCLQLGRILQATTRVSGHTHYDEILQLDQQLRDIKAELPPHLRLQPIGSCQDPLTVIIARYNLEILYQKVVCLLHRNSMSKSRQNPRYAHSRRSAIEASMANLKHLHDLCRESGPNGRLKTIQWYVTSMATKDFLLPALLIASDLHDDFCEERSRNERKNSQATCFWTQDQRDEMISALERTRDIWQGLADVSVEAFKAFTGLKIVLEKIRSPATSPEDSSQSSTTRSDVFTTPPSDVTSDGDQAVFGATIGQEVPPVSMPASAPGQFDLLQNGLGANFNPLDPATVPSGGVDMMPEFFPMEGMMGPQSPLSMFNNIENGIDFSNNTLDWDQFQTYTQTANFGTDQVFNLFPNEPQEPQPPQATSPLPDDPETTFRNMFTSPIRHQQGTGG